jgi:hypothetical protein
MLFSIKCDFPHLGTIGTQGEVGAAQKVGVRMPARRRIRDGIFEVIRSALEEVCAVKNGPEFC